eukprot:scaffold30055_cov118-Isochrysis_galbana.AAC.7
MTGRPYSSTNSCALATEMTGSSVPGTTGTPAAMAATRAVVLSANVFRLATVGPTNVMPASWHACANAGDSDRKPYPGWMASTCLSLAMRMICSMSRYEATAGAFGVFFSSKKDWSAPHRCWEKRSSYP